MSPAKGSLSRTEWSLMNICWQKGVSSACDIYNEALNEKREYQTAKTMLDRLAAKGLLHRNKSDSIWLNAPAASRAKMLSCEIESFSHVLLNNTLTPIPVHFAQREKIATLKKIIREHEQS